MGYMRDASGRRLDSIKVIAGPGTRVASCPATAPNIYNAASALDLTQRTVLRLPFAAARWRIGFRNQNLRSTTPGTTPCTITGIWAGTPAFDTGATTAARWNGNMAAAPSQVSNGLTVPIDGTRVWTPWIEAHPFAPKVNKCISWGLTSTATGSGIAGGNGYQGCTAPGAANAANTTLAGASLAANALHLDVVIEYEFAESIRTVVVIGDSNTVQFGGSPALISNAGSSSLPHESWPMLAGAMGGFAVINLGVGSAQTGDFASTYPALWERLPAGLDADAFIVSLGVNNIAAGLTAHVPQTLAINAKIRDTYGCDTIWWTTITPRAFPDGAYTLGGTKVGGTLTTDAAAGATSIITTIPPTVGQAMLIGLGPNAESRTVTATSGAGPYTCTVGALTSAHYAGEPVSIGDEIQRRLINNWLRQVPDGITGTFDFERLLESSPGSPVLDARYANNDWLHTIRSVGPLKASMIVGAGVQPLFI